MLRRHVLVAELPRLVVGAIEDAVQLPRERRLGITLLWIAGDLPLDPLPQLLDAHAELVEQRSHDPLILIQQRRQEMYVVHQWVAVLSSEADGVVQRLGA